MWPKLQQWDPQAHLPAPEKVPHASKRYMNLPDGTIDLNDMNDGYADMVMRLDGSTALPSQIWEVKAFSQWKLATPQAEWYVSQWNRTQA